MNTSRNGEPWTEGEIKAIKSGKYTDEEMAKYFNRSIAAIKRKRWEYHAKKGKKNE